MKIAEEKTKIAVVEAYSGKVVNKKIIEGESIEEVVKSVASELLREKWLPKLSDFIVLRDKLDVELELPLSDDEYAFYKRFDLKKINSNLASASLPLYLIVYESLKLSEDEFHDRGVAAVSVVHDEEDLEELIELLEETTKAPTLREEEVEALKELESELIEEEKKSRSRGGKSKA
ncbi:MAG: DUF2286 domain-containing protein [Fervidicoccaceae archaeon]